ncbi:hypothetical protein O5699_25785 [Escherichia coli]|nr:hypothetical protein [Escherichia coli]
MRRRCARITGLLPLPEHNDELRLDDGEPWEDGKDGSALLRKFRLAGFTVTTHWSGFLGSSGLFPRTGL